MKLRFNKDPNSPLANKDFRTTLGVVFVVMLGFGIIAPVLPLYARSFGVGYAAAGLLISVFGLVRLVSQTPGGFLIEKFGEKPIAVAGLVIVALSSFASAAAGSFSMLLVARSIGGIGSAWFITAMYSHVLSLVEPQRAGRALSLYQGAFTAGITMGPVVGGLLAQIFGLRAPFFVYGLFCLAATVLAVIRISPTRKVLPIDQPEARGLPRDPRFVLAVLANVALWITFTGSRITLVPLMAVDRLDLSEAAIGGILTAGAIASFVVLPHAGRAADRSRARVLAVAMLVTAGLTAAIGFSTAVLFFVVLTALAGAASGYARVPVSALVADSTAGRARGKAVALHQMAGDLGGVIGPVLAGALVQGLTLGPLRISSIGFEGAFIVLAIPSAILGVATLFVREARKRATRKAELSEFTMGREI